MLFALNVYVLASLLLHTYSVCEDPGERGNQRAREPESQRTREQEREARAKEKCERGRVGDDDRQREMSILPP